MMDGKKMDAKWPEALSLVNPVTGGSFVVCHKGPIAIADSAGFSRKRKGQLDWAPDVITHTTTSYVCDAILLTGCEVEVQAAASPEMHKEIWKDSFLSLTVEGENVMQRPLTARMDLNPEVFKHCPNLFRAARKDGSLAGIFMANGSRIICRVLHVPVAGLDECEIRVRLNAALYTTKGAPGEL